MNLERFWKHVAPMMDDRGCWEWAASRQPSGYGQLMEQTKRVPLYAHRLSWQLHNGSIPAGMHVLHHCDNRGCVNPDHLFLGTNYDNILDCKQKGRNNGAASACRRGHPFDEGNTRWSFYKGDGKVPPHWRRVCRACVKVRRATGASTDTVAADLREATN